MLSFKVRKSANIIDKKWGSGQIWVSFPDDRQYVWGDAGAREGEFRRLYWRLGWNDDWLPIEGWWDPIEKRCYIDDIMKFEENQSVMFLIPDQ